MPRPIATNRRVDRDELLAFLRPRHHVILATTRADGSAQVSPVTAGVDAGGRLVVSTLREYYRSISGEHPDWDEYRAAMQQQGKCLVRISTDRWGPIATGGFPPEFARPD